MVDQRTREQVQVTAWRAARGAAPHAPTEVIAAAAKDIELELYAAIGRTVDNALTAAVEALRDPTSASLRR